jgi:two-component system, NarL family, response regulator LiaR
MLLKLEPDIEVIGLSEDGARAIEMVAKDPPDMVLMDLKMPIQNGVEATRRIKSQWPQVKVLVLTTYDDDEWVLNAVHAGASGYLLKDAPRKELINAIRGTMAGKTYIDPSVAGKVLRQATSHKKQPSAQIIDKLTEREVEVLRMLARGSNNKEISERLVLSEGTVRNHISSILAKLNVTDRTQAAVIAIQHGLSDD